MINYLKNKLNNESEKLTFEELLELQKYILERYEELGYGEDVEAIKDLITHCSKLNYRLIIADLEEIEE